MVLYESGLIASQALLNFLRSGGGNLLASVAQAATAVRGSHRADELKHPALLDPAAEEPGGALLAATVARHLALRQHKAPVHALVLEAHQAEERLWLPRRREPRRVRRPPLHVQQQPRRTESQLVGEVTRRRPVARLACLSKGPAAEVGQGNGRGRLDTEEVGCRSHGACCTAPMAGARTAASSGLEVAHGSHHLPASGSKSPGSRRRCLGPRP
mmetsp:Transcript_34946/g.96638  ORF Transcript_34946/g.96638 Transcript_34946/m.96638 type:complete len:214 (+) Transcript_34946:1042-1683(+)